MTALFIASKNLEVDPLDLQTCAKTLCFNKYARPQFLKRETDIRLATQYENESPTILDFVMFYICLIKLQTQKQMDCLPETQQFLSDMTTITYDLCKSVSIDANLFKYRPSILAAALTFVGFQLQFELLLSNGQLCSRSKGKKDVCGQIAQMFRIWKVSVLESVLGLDEIQKIMVFSEHVLSRQLSLFEEYG